jgi:hypothetical protein
MNLKGFKMIDLNKFIEEAHIYSFQENRGQFVFDDFAEKLAELICADEREACAKVCESYLSESPYSWGGTTMAAAIRARGQA